MTQEIRRFVYFYSGIKLRLVEESSIACTKGGEKIVQQKSQT